MADEATIRVSLQIRIGDRLYQSQPTAFTADVATESAGSPGDVTVTPQGVEVDLSQLDNPSLYIIQNLDDENIITVGIWDPQVGRFYPFHDILPGEIYPGRFSRHLREEYGTGTGTVGGSQTNSLMFRSDISSCRILLHAFEL
jgi:hypothetical protein